MSNLSSLAGDSSLSPIAQLAGNLKAAADPLRLEVLRVLAQDSYGVLELCEIFAIKQSAMSHHLKVLTTGGLAATRREGNSIYYRRAHPEQEWQRELFQSLDEMDLDSEVAQRVMDVQQQRREASQAFFQVNAHKFKAQQDLIAHHPVYAEPVANLLRKIKTGSERVIEIGPGSGEFLETLAEEFEQVIGLDNSSSMLAQAEQTVAEVGLSNVSLIHGEVEQLLAEELRADCVVMNMVLHHTPAPSDIFQAAATLLNPGGILLVTDLCEHDQQWVKESCGDVWLGFEPQDFSNWAQSAQLEEGESVYFALRNGFQIQIRHFFKP